MRVSDYAKYYCRVPAWWTQYEVLILLFLSTQLISTFYSGMVVIDSVDDKKHVLIIAFVEFVFSFGVMSVITARDGACTVSTPMTPVLTI